MQTNNLRRLCSTAANIVPAGETSRAARNFLSAVRKLQQAADDFDNHEQPRAYAITIVEALGELHKVTTNLRYCPEKTERWRSERSNFQSTVYQEYHNWRMFLAHSRKDGEKIPA